MLISYWDSKDQFVDRDQAYALDRNEMQIMGAMLRNMGRNAAVLSTVEIETINRCNNDCTFCPANRNQDIRPMMKMEMELFQKIIDELAQMDFRGRISLFSNDEPLLDDRFFEFLDYARKKLPNAYHSLFTNGILLNDEKYLKLIDKLDYLRINNYNDDLELNSNIKAISDRRYNEKNCQVVVEVRKKTQILMNRGGLSPNNHTYFHYSSACILPFVQMVIRPDGSVSRCCQDVYGNETLGNVKYQKINEIWNGSKYEQYRKDMLDGKRKKIPYCCDCDINGLTNYYPHDWEYFYLETVINIIKEQYRNNKKILVYGGGNAEFMLQMLGLHGVVAECSFLESDLELYIKEKYFIVLNENSDKATQLIEEYKYEAGMDYILYARNPIGNIPWRKSENRNEDMALIKRASLDGKLVIFGAGMTAKRLIDALELKPILIVDNIKAGSFLRELRVEKPEKISLFEDKKILVAAFDYGDIVKQLNGMGISSKDIILGYKLLL